MIVMIAVVIIIVIIMTNSAPQHKDAVGYARLRRLRARPARGGGGGPSNGRGGEGGRGRCRVGERMGNDADMKPGHITMRLTSTHQMDPKSSQYGSNNRNNNSSRSSSIVNNNNNIIKNNNSVINNNNNSPAMGTRASLSPRLPPHSLHETGIAKANTCRQH